MLDNLKDFLKKDYRWVHPKKRKELQRKKQSKQQKLKNSKRIDISDIQRNRIYKRDNYRCVLCGCEHNLCIHHRKKVSEGGTNDDDNLVTLCYPCHAKQHPEIANFILQSWYDILIKEIEDNYFSNISKD